MTRYIGALPWAIIALLYFVLCLPMLVVSTLVNPRVRM